MIQESNFQRRLDEFGCPADTFCRLANISPSKWSRALRDIQPLTGPELEHIGKVVDLIAGIVRDSEPIPVSFRNISAIKTLIETRKKGARWIPILVGSQDVVQEFEDLKNSSEVKLPANAGVR